MGALDWLRGMFTKASATDGPKLAMVSPGQPIWTPQNYETLAKEGYQTSVYVYSAVSMIAQAVAGVPLLLYRQRGSVLTEIETHPLLSLLDRPNPMQSGTQLRENLVAYRLLSGNSYLERVGPDGNRPPRELYALRPDRTTVIPGTGDPIVAGYQYEAGGTTVKLAPELILHWKTFNPLDDWYGMAPLVAASRSMTQNNVAKAWNVASLQNSARPSGALTYEGGLNDKQLKALQSEIDVGWRGAANARRPLLLEKGMGWKQMGLSPVDMDWLEGQKLSAREIAVAFRVPSQLLGDIEGSTQANYEQARKALYQEAVLPLLDNLLDELNRWLVPLFGPDLRLAYDADQIEALSEDRDKVWTRTKDAWFLRLNEARSAVGYDEDPEHGHLYGWQIDVIKRFGTLDVGKPATTSGAKAIVPANGKALAETIEARRQPFYRAVTAQVVKRFAEERDAVKAAIAAGGDPLVALDLQTPEWVKLLQSVYLAVGGAFATEQLLDLKHAAGPTSVKADITAAELAATEAAIWAYIQANGLSRAEMLKSTTGKAILARTAELIAEGADPTKLMLAVDDIYAVWMGEASVMTEVVATVQTRAETIAITDVVNAAGVGQAAGADESGLPLDKEWNSTLDGVVRPTHLAAHGQTVPMSQPFTVGGYSLMHPGDSSMGAPAAIAANCRCFVAYTLAL